MPENNLFILKHKNEDVALIQMTSDGEIDNYEIFNQRFMPYLGSNDPYHLHTWWNNRAIPEGREHLLPLLKKHNCSNPSELLMKNLGLSLTDTYWICPARLNLSWEEVNLFDNGNKELKFHDGYGKVHYTNDKDAALIGSLFKYANFIDNEWYMIKYGNTKYPNGIQNVNEKFASIVHYSQGFKEFVPYLTMSKNKGDNEICKCKFFTNKNAELISAHEITGGTKPNEQYDAETELNKFIDICEINGLSKEYVNRFLDYMIMTDFIITNSDRHWDNFGILRNPDTLDFISMAPIFDNGNSMFYNNPYELRRISLLRLKDNGITKNEIDRLKLVKDRSVVKSELLPLPNDVKKFYMNHGIKDKVAEAISYSYSNKLDLFMEYQHKIPINYAMETEYIDKTPYTKQKPNPEFFKEKPEMLTPEIQKEISNKHNKINGEAAKFLSMSDEEYQDVIISLNYPDLP